MTQARRQNLLNASEQISKGKEQNPLCQLATHPHQGSQRVDRKAIAVRTTQIEVNNKGSDKVKLANVNCLMNNRIHNITVTRSLFGHRAAKTLTRWTALAPLGMQLRWEAEIIKQEADRMVSWKSTSGDVATAGSVHFEAKGDKSTEVRVSMRYDPPGGKVVAAVAEFFNVGLDTRVREDLQQFKDRLEKRKSPT